MATTIFKPSGEVTRVAGRPPAQPSSVSADMQSAGLHDGGGRVISDRAGSLLHEAAGHRAETVRNQDRGSAKASQALDRANRRATRRADKEHQRVIQKASEHNATLRNQDQERQEQRAMMAAGRQQVDAANRLSGKVAGSTNGRAILLFGSMAENPLLDPATREQLELELTQLNQPGIAIERSGRSEDLKPGEALALATQVGVAPVLAAEAELVQVTTQLNDPTLDDAQRRALEEQLELITFGVNQSAEFAMIHGPAIPAAMAKEIESMLVDGLRIGGFQYARENSEETARMPSFMQLFKPNEVTTSFAFAA